MIHLNGLLYLGVVAGLLVLNGRPAGALVGRVVRSMPGAQDRTERGGAGALVGILERLLIFTLILIGEWSVIGFVIAAKSIARFKELEDKDYTDYYLAGTLTSIIIAVVTGVLALGSRRLL